MDYLQAAVLGIVQGLTEFLPISSSGHLILVPWLFGWDDQGLAFDVGLHAGTLLALLSYFWRDWVRMIRAGLEDVYHHGRAWSRYSTDGRILWLIAVGSIPAAIAGGLLDQWFEDNVRQPWLVAITIAAVAVVLLAAERYTRKRRELRDLGLADSATIGLAQACALIPGVSRSGATITAGLFRGFRRADAARFAFLLGTPAFVGAALLKAPDVAGEGGHEFAKLGVGFAFSAVVGFAVIHLLLRYLRTRTLLIFVAYRFAVAALVLVLYAVRA